MGGIRPISLIEPIPSGVISTLRHDLLTPINLIVGYCDLLLSETDELGSSSYSAALRSIRSIGFQLLGQIDQVLVAETPDRSVTAIQNLADQLIGPAKVLIADCDTLKAESLFGSHGAEFAADLDRIRNAGVRMISMAEALASGHFPSEDPAMLPPTSSDEI